VESYKKRQIFFRSPDTIIEKTVASGLNETEMILAVTFDLRISARRYGKALETPRCLAADGLLAL
jgi:hypothetical protein